MTCYDVDQEMKLRENVKLKSSASQRK